MGRQHADGTTARMSVGRARDRERAHSATQCDVERCEPPRKRTRPEAPRDIASGPALGVSRGAPPGDAPVDGSAPVPRFFKRAAPFLISSRPREADPDFGGGLPGTIGSISL
jgi:hypothetical protein